MSYSKFFDDIKNWFGKNPPTRGIYHYTDANAFLNIMQKKELWATHINFMNDSFEGLIGYNILDKILKYKKEFKKNDEKEIKQLNHLLNDLKQNLDTINIFIVSFTSSQDDLNQWRGYAETPNGLNIKFNSSLLSENIISSKNIDSIISAIQKIVFEKKPLEEIFLLMPCLYKEDMQSSLLYDLKNQILNNNTDFFDSDAYNAAKLLIFFTPFLKEKSFKDEKEWRLAIFLPKSSNKICYRIGKSSIIPFYKFSFNPDSVTGVKLGPARPDKKLIKTSVEFFVNKGLQQKNIEITESKIPYRNW